MWYYPINECLESKCLEPRQNVEAVTSRQRGPITSNRFNSTKKKSPQRPIPAFYTKVSSSNPSLRHASNSLYKKSPCHYDFTRIFSSRQIIWGLSTDPWRQSQGRRWRHRMRQPSHPRLSLRQIGRKAHRRLDACLQTRISKIVPLLIPLNAGTKTYSEGWWQPWRRQQR